MSRSRSRVLLAKVVPVGPFSLILIRWSYLKVLVFISVIFSNRLVDLASFVIFWTHGPSASVPVN